MGGYMCMYYGEGKRGEYFRCYSEGNPGVKGESHFKDFSPGLGTEKLFSYCVSADENGCAQNCPWFVASKGGINQSKVPDQQREMGRKGQSTAVGAAPGESPISGRYTFVPEKGMCKYYCRSESDRKKYQCLSPGNGHGPDFLFETLGASSGAEHYRKQCRRCNEAGEPPKCDFYPGAVQNSDGGSGDTGSLIGEGLKQAVNMAMNPAGSIAETVVNHAVEGIVGKLFE